MSTPFPSLNFLLAKPNLMFLDEILKRIFQDCSKNLFHTFLSFFGLNNSVYSRCKVCFYKSIAVNTSLVDYISWLVDYRGSRLTVSGYYIHVMLTIVMLLWASKIFQIHLINNNLPLLWWWTNLHRTTNLSPPLDMIKNKDKKKKTMQKIANLNEVYS